MMIDSQKNKGLMALYTVGEDEAFLLAFLEKRIELLYFSTVGAIRNSPKGVLPISRFYELIAPFSKVEGFCFLKILRKRGLLEFNHMTIKLPEKVPVISNSKNGGEIDE